MDLALAGGTIYPSPTEEPIRDGVVVIRGGVIASLGGPPPEGVPSLDCSGLAITAGFWNSHVHFFERKWADAGALPAPELERQLEDAFARYGFTSVFDLSSEWENTRRLRERIGCGEVAGPRIRSTGEGLVPPGAVPSDEVCRIMGVMRTALPEVSDAAQATAACRALLDKGVDAVKLFASSPRGTALSEEAMAAAVAEAHARGRMVFVHPNSAADIRNALRAGVDMVAHTTPRSGPWDDALLAAMLERGAAVTPTLTLWKHYLRHDRASVQDQVVETAVGQLRAWAARGGTVLFGTDLGAVDYDPRDEYALMAEAGMDFRRILASLTTAPAEFFGESHRLGRIAPGFQADLAVWKDSPADVRYTLLSGRILFRGGGRAGRRTGSM